MKKMTNALLGVVILLFAATLYKFTSEPFSQMNLWLIIGESVVLSLVVMIMFAREVIKAGKPVPQEVEERWQQMIDLVKKNPQICRKSIKTFASQSFETEQKEFWSLYGKPLPEGWGIGWCTNHLGIQKIVMLHDNAKEFEIIREYIISES